MKRTNVLLSSVLAVTFLASCTTVEYVADAPQCTRPERPLLAAINKGELWDTFTNSESYMIAQAEGSLDLTTEQEAAAIVQGDAEYRALERYINTLYGFSEEQHATLEEICQTAPVEKEE